MSSRASRPAVVELLAAFDRAMRRGRLRWYVFGAQAVVAYGRPRMTADVDIAVEIRDGSRRALVNRLQRYGFALRIELDDDFLASSNLLPLVHAPTGIPVDVVVAQRGLQSEFLRRAQRVDIGGKTVPFVSVEDLVAMKVLAGRRKDIDDVRGILLERWHQIDLARTRDVLERFLEVTGDSRLLPRLQRLERQVRRTLGPRAATTSKTAQAAKGKRPDRNRRKSSKRNQTRKKSSTKR